MCTQDYLPHVVLGKENRKIPHQNYTDKLKMWNPLNKGNILQVFTATNFLEFYD